MHHLFLQHEPRVECTQVELVIIHTTLPPYHTVYTAYSAIRISYLFFNTLLCRDVLCAIWNYKAASLVTGQFLPFFLGKSRLLLQKQEEYKETVVG